MLNFYAGTSSMTLPVPNKTYYPVEFRDKSRLCYYASLFNSIEVNSSFYKIPQAGTVIKWTREVPDDFRFTFKLWRGITHEKGLIFDPADVDNFLQTVEAIGQKKGCLLVQFPPSAKVDLLPQLMQLVDCIRNADLNRSWNIALEFRNSSWYGDETHEWVVANNLCVVIQDIPASATPIDFANSDTVYLRFHGPGGKYRGSYDDAILQEYSFYIREWQEEKKTVYVYFNNTMGDAAKNLTTLKNLVVNH